MKLVFKDLYLYSTSEKVAKKVSFSEGINVITSNQFDGTDRGKSVILRSLYHAMGADALFDGQWDDKNKIYILYFSIDETCYYIYRAAELFKFFDENKNLLFMTSSRHDLAEKLSSFIQFAVQLPNRHEDKLEVTPPVYNYILNFLDQDYYNGTIFSSFANLGQYKDYKENVLYYHFGAYDQKYFDLIRSREQYTDKKTNAEARFDLLSALQSDVEVKLESKQICTNLEALSAEIDLYKSEYSQLLSILSKSRKTLLNLRNQEVDIAQALQELEALYRKNNRDINSIELHHCPECNSIIDDVVPLRSKKFNLSEDIILVKNRLLSALEEIKDSITNEEQKYGSLLNSLKQYESKMKINTSQINDVLRYKGFCEIRNGIVLEKSELYGEIDQLKQRIKDIQKQIKKYADKKKAINDKYQLLLLQSREKFGLNEIDPKSFKTLTSNFKASGSNKPIVTVIWYTTLIALRDEFNSNKFDIPVVFDSPNNAETDDYKRHDLLQYILNSNLSKFQLILSSIGFRKEDFQCSQDINVMVLENEKYHLLDSESYEKYLDLLLQLCDAR